MEAPGFSPAKSCPVGMASATVPLERRFAARLKEPALSEAEGCPFTVLLEQHSLLHGTKPAIANALPRPRHCPRQRHCGRHHHRERHLSGSIRNDAGRRLGPAGSTGVACGRRTLACRRHHLRRTRRHEAAGRRRVYLHPRRLRTVAGIPLWLDVVCYRQARVHRHFGDRPGSHPGIVFHPGFLKPNSHSRSAGHQLRTARGDGGGRPHHRAELHRHPARRQFPARLHAAQNRDHHCRLAARVHRLHRNLAKLRHQLRRLDWRGGRFHDCPRRRVVGLRRMERSEYGQRGNPQPRPRDPHRAHRWCRRGRGALHADQRRRAVRAARGEHRSLVKPHVGRYCNRRWTLGCGDCFRRAWRSPSWSR